MLLYKFSVVPYESKPIIQIETFEAVEKPQMYVTNDRQSVAKNKIGVVQNKYLLTMWSLTKDVRYFKEQIKYQQTQEYNALKAQIDEKIAFLHKIDQLEFYEKL